MVKTEPACETESDSQMDDRDALSNNYIVPDFDLEEVVITERACETESNLHMGELSDKDKGLETYHIIINESDDISEAQCNEVITRPKKRVMKGVHVGKVRKSRKKLDNKLEKPAISRPNKRLVRPDLPVIRTPRKSIKVPDPEANELLEEKSSGRPRARRESAAPTIGSPRPSSQVLAGPSSKSSRTSLTQVRMDQDVADIVTYSDSGSDTDDDDDDDEEYIEDAGTTNMRLVARKLRDISIFREEGESETVDEVIGDLVGEVDPLGVRTPTYEGSSLTGADIMDVAEDDEAAGVLTVGGVNAGSESLNTFSWSEDFSTFSGQEEVYKNTPGPLVSCSDDPVQLFKHVWDVEIVTEIKNQTNLYAWQTIAKLSEEYRLPKFLNWEDTTVDEIYRLFAILIYMSLCYRARVEEYWTTGVLGMVDFRKIMPRNRFCMLMRFLHFVDNDYAVLDSSYQKKIAKIAPIVEHCNRKFSSMYTPQRELSLDESLLLWKGRLSWAQCIRTKAARFGIKSFDLCESQSGYVLRSLLYAGKNSSMSKTPIHGFKNSVAKVVLELMDGYLDVGHLLVMDNWYNQLPLSRYLKGRRTDVIGTMNRQRLHVPPAIKNVVESRMARGDIIAQHCGDLTVVAWKDLRLVTAVSTFHNAEQVDTRRAGELIKKPLLVTTYNRFMGGVDLKDQKLSMFLMERKRGLKWYMKVFRRLINESLLNTYIIYSKNPLFQVHTHRQFRYQLADGLLKLHKRVTIARLLTNPPSDLVRLDDRGGHYPVHTAETTTADKHRHSRRRCSRCSKIGKKTQVTTMCSKCDVPLCLGKCWIEYHTLEKL